MKFSTRDLQARLAALGFHPGPIDGIDGRRTRGALDEALKRFSVDRARQLFSPEGLHRIHWHWTAGAYGMIQIESDSYNFLLDHEGEVHEGSWPAEAQAAYAPGCAASHTLNANTGAIGVSCDAMAGAQERPFRKGSAPLTWPQIEGMVQLTAQLCAKYWIPVTRWSVLSHAEVQPTLGITQRWKWDIAWLPDMAEPGDPVEVGDRLRRMVIEAMPKDMAA
ncbi:N-acetylmuramoyl-L-alanine amidase [Pseudooceanicola sp.]|uniref:N-acetylmuramoyl-L-alanine amidase n=1 Tax=Pseudooceanicola sp. TaxID=1914328 RepID=UPI00405820A0